MEYVESFKSLAFDQWWVIILAIVVIYLVSKIAKSFVKWAVIIAVLLFFLNYGTNYQAFVADVKGKVWSVAEDFAYKKMTQNTEQATYELNPDGTFTVKTEGVRISGAASSEKLKVTYKGITFDVDRTSFLQRYIEDAQK